MATEITVIRHGETEWNVQKKIQGQNNSDLTKNGILQAELVAKALNKRSFDLLITSDLGRAADTAQIINKQLNLDLHFNTQIRERNFGVFEGKTYKQLESEFPGVISEFQKRNPDWIVPNGESITMLYNRIVSEIEEIATTYKNKKILIVTHGLVLEMMMYKTFNIRLENSRMFSINNSSISSFYIDSGNWFLKEWGVIEHLVNLNVLNEL